MCHTDWCDLPPAAFKTYYTVSNPLIQHLSFLEPYVLTPLTLSSFHPTEIEDLTHEKGYRSSAARAVNLTRSRGPQTVWGSSTWSERVAFSLASGKDVTLKANRDLKGF